MTTLTDDRHSSNNHVFCGRSLNLGLSSVFHTIRLELWVLRKTTEEKHHCQHILSRKRAISITRHWWREPWSPSQHGVCQVSPMECYSFPPFHIFSVKGSHSVPATLRRCRVVLYFHKGAVSTQVIWNSVSCFFSHLLYQCGPREIYFIFCIII